VGVAVNVTEVPEHTGFAEGEMDIETGDGGYTCIVIIFDVSGLLDEQIAFEVKMQKTWSPFTG
jgi:hypothetical protein